jgi:molecular chaperone GrpE
MQKPGNDDLDIPPFGQPYANQAPQPPHAEQPAPADAMAGALAVAEGQITELKDQVLRARAELENQRRRLERDKEDSIRYAAARFAKDILSVADNLGRALAALPQGEELPPAVKTLADGVAATERELLSVFERHGITRVVAEGARFDPNLHQAMMEQDDPSKPAGTVLHVMMPGYVQHDRLLRPAMVVVSKGGPSEPKVDTQA